jgi:nitrogen-specific signal transduction histidine kinase
MKDLSTWTLAANSVHSPHWTTLHLLPAQSVTTATAAPTSVLPLLPGDPLAAEPFCLVMTPGFSLVMVLGETLTEEAAFMFSFEPAVVQRAWETIRPRILLMNSQQVERLDELVQWFSPVTPDYRTVMQFSRLMLQHLPEPLDELCLGQVGNSLVGKTVQNGTTGSPSKTKGRGTLGRQERVISPNRPQVEPAIALSAAAPTHSGNSHSGSSHSGNSHSGNSHSGNSSATSSPGQSLDVELVQAIAHEVRTPLTTIRTLTRSLLKRTDLPPDVLRRLSIIDRECNQQIDRFGLIFRAVELETSAAQQASMSLIRTSLADVFQQSIPRWQQQAGQRQMKLDVLVPQTMPMVVSDPTVLDQALTSLIERFTRNLPAGSHIQVEVTLAGEQLKLQLQSHPEAACNGNSRETGGGGSNAHQSAPKFIGQLLMFQPETGCLSLNLSVTKNLFQAIGGKLTVKQRPQKGEVMTVYLPLEVSGSSLWDSNKIITV